MIFPLRGKGSVSVKAHKTRQSINILKENQGWWDFKIKAGGNSKSRRTRKNIAVKPVVIQILFFFFLLWCW